MHDCKHATLLTLRPMGLTVFTVSKCFCFFCFFAYHIGCVAAYGIFFYEGVLLNFFGELIKIF